MCFKEGLLSPIETKYLVDATGDAKICQKLNCEFLGTNSQPSNLRFIMSGVNTTEFSKWIMELDKDRDVTTSCTIDGKIYLSTAYTWDSNKDWALKPVFNAAIENGDITEADSNYFQIFSVAGTPDSIAFNCPRLLDTSSNPFSYTHLDVYKRQVVIDECGSTFNPNAAIASKLPPVIVPPVISIVPSLFKFAYKPALVLSLIHI